MLNTLDTWNQHICIYENNGAIDLDPRDVEGFVESLFASGTTIKESKRSQLVKSKSAGQGYVAKRYKTRKMRYLANGLIHGRGSLPAWNNIFLLRELEISTLDPVLLLEQRYFRFPRESFLVTREIIGENLSAHLRKNEGDIAQSQLDQLKEMLNRLYDAKFLHGDLNEDNIMITDEGPVIIDLDKLSRARSQRDFDERYGPERDRFLRKLQPWPDARERIKLLFP